MFNSGEIIALVSIAAAFILLFVPVAALTTRKVVKDVTEVLDRRRSGGEGVGVTDQVEALRRDLARLAEDVDGLRGEVRRLSEGTEFERQLRSSSEE